MNFSRRWAWLLAIEIILLVTPLLFPDGIPLLAALACYAVALGLGLYAGLQWLGHRRIVGQAWPGVAAHFILRMHEGQPARRRYIFDQFKADGGAAALFLSASDVFTLRVTDIRGEQYPLETPLGRRGLPIAQWVYVAVEVAITPKTTRLSVSINGKEVSSRTLGFRVNLGGSEWGKQGTVGSDRTGKNNGEFDLGEFILRDKTLSGHEKNQLLVYFENKWHILDH